MSMTKRTADAITALIRSPQFKGLRAHAAEHGLAAALEVLVDKAGDRAPVNRADEMEVLKAKPFLTLRDMVTYGAFRSEKAARRWLDKHPIPRLEGSRILVKRADFERVRARTV